MTIPLRKKRPKRPKLTESSIQERGYRESPFGPCLYIKIWREDGKPMGWEEIWERFVDRYPDQWAIQVFPPRTHVVNEVNYYHLFVFDQWDRSLTIN